MPTHPLCHHLFILCTVSSLSHNVIFVVVDISGMLWHIIFSRSTFSCNTR